MAANMYRVGDYVYFETSSTSPYLIRRIEELNKTPNGNVEAKVMCFYRRRDISNSLIVLADKHHSNTLDDEPDRKRSSSPTETSSSPPSDTTNVNGNGNGGGTGGEESEVKPFSDVPEKQRHQLKHRELFLSRQVETLPATHIRGKCVVTLLNETESLTSYLNKEDTFFYSLVYDPQQKTLLADKGEIRVGSKFQAEVPSKFIEVEDDQRQSDQLETLIWRPENGLSKKEIDQFLVIARSVGTFARALDCTSTVRQPSLHMSAAAASRDITLFHAMDTLHKHGYDISKAIRSLVPDGGPVLCRDEMEEWSASEANLFEEALDKYGKDFNDIRQDFLPWKSLKSIVEYYYMWKTTDRYVQQKRIKAAEAESKLKQVYIPNYNKPNPAALAGKVNGADGQVSGRACESCYTAHSSQWFSWGPAHMQCRLCSACWMYWKKYGGLKMPTRLGAVSERSTQGQTKVTSSYPSIMKKRGFEQSNGLDGPTPKRPNMGVIRQAGASLKAPVQRGLLNHGSINGRSKGVPGTRGVKMHMISWIDMPDDVYFVATEATRKLRKQLQGPDFKRAARNPWRILNVKSMLSLSAIPSVPRDRSPAPAQPQEVVVLD
ncbi:metastasis-associated protein MTA1-like isoform X2 [Pomacea canaliculata]|uniref:metastasis-associated protein MTA1-like isoform X2 n=1 Tax=Pomacea canaliculata TaxID=400727 RepID=UPI000D72CC3E|nr:metastasis-associated protein MTA1-like isoform X2 [Pomacea canaliculata]